MKKYITPTVLILGSFSCFLVYNIIGSHITENGTLVEPFGLIPTGFLLFSLGIIIGLVISIWSLFNNPKKSDKWIFGIFTSVFVICSLYFVASMSYLTERANEEISQNQNL